MDWATVFLPTVPILELVVRGGVSFLALLLLLRVVGQREAGGLGVTDLLVVVLVADAAGAGITERASTVGDSSSAAADGRRGPQSPADGVRGQSVSTCKSSPLAMSR